MPGKIFLQDKIDRRIRDCASMPIFRSSNPHFLEVATAMFQDPAVSYSFKKTTVTALRSLQQLEGIQSFETLTPAHFEVWHQANRQSPKVIPYRTALRKLCQHFVDAQLLPANPVEKRPNNARDLSMPSIVEALPGAKAVILDFLQARYPELYLPRSARQRGLPRTGISHMTALRNFCRYLAEIKVLSLTDIKRQQIEDYMVISNASTVTCLRQIFSALVEANILKENPFFLYAEEARRNPEITVPNLARLLRRSGLGATEIWQSFYDKYRRKIIYEVIDNAVDDFALFLCDVASVSSIKDISRKHFLT